MPKNIKHGNRSLMDMTLVTGMSMNFVEFLKLVNYQRSIDLDRDIDRDGVERGTHNLASNRSTFRSKNNDCRSNNYEE